MSTLTSFKETNMQITFTITKRTMLTTLLSVALLTAAFFAGEFTQAHKAVDADTQAHADGLPQGMTLTKPSTQKSTGDSLEDEVFGIKPSPDLPSTPLTPNAQTILNRMQQTDPCSIDKWNHDCMVKSMQAADVNRSQSSTIPQQ
jgi:hypothetical protein